ncbi:ATP-binding protein [Streptomyces sp. NPDC003703]|uniref:ATP-binding protein n=1 Tax=Streptomyces sp. NPDC003283 TaxID=3364681 RepID=UPI0036D1CB95
MIERRRGIPPARCKPLIGSPAVLTVEGEPRSAGSARAFVREFMASNVPDASEEYVESVVLVACEVVTNSIRYGTEPGDSIRLTLDADHVRTRVEVQDPVRRRPRPRPESDDRERGRGLIILDALCIAWGVTPAPFGKSLWAEVKAP